jgi:hypothetical protein
VNEAHYRVEVAVDGDHVSALRAYWKIPEVFERSRDRQNFISIAVWIVRIVAIALGIVFGIWMLIRRIRQGLVPWRRTLLLAAVPTVLTIAALALSFHLFLYRNYPTSIPFETFTVTAAVVLAIEVAFAFVLFAAAAALVLSFFPESLAALRQVRHVLAWDAVVLLLVAIGLWQFWHQSAALLSDRLHALAFVEVDDPSLIGLPLPALTAVIDAIRTIFSRAAILALGVLALRNLPKRWMAAPLVLLLAFVAVSGDVRTPGEFALSYGTALAGLGFTLAFCMWFARRNYLAYLLAFTLSALYPAAAELFQSGNQALAMQGWMVVGAAVLAVAWAVGPALFQRESSPLRT